MRSIGIKIIFLGIILLVGISTLVMLLWNWLIPGIFGLTTINFWEALGLFILSRILLGNFPFGGKRPQNTGRNPMHDKWMKMTFKQRKEFIEKRRKSGFGGPFNRRGFAMKFPEESQK